MLWHDESGIEMGGRYAPIGRRSGHYFVRTARSAGTIGTSPFDAAAVCSARPHHSACGGRHGCARERAGTHGVAEDGAVLAQAVAAGGRRRTPLCTTGAGISAYFTGGGPPPMTPIARSPSTR